MRSIKKEILFLKNIILMVFSNITRLILSISGLFVGLFILAVGLLLMNSYYDECMSKVKAFSNNTLMIEIGGEKECVSQFTNKVKEEISSRKYIADDIKCIYIKEYTNRQYCVLNSKIVGTTAMDDRKVLAKYEDFLYIPYDAEIISGRMINASDVASCKRVVVIDEFTAKMLYGEKNPIGQKLNLNVQADGIANISGDGDIDNQRNEFTIIGVFKNKKLTMDNELHFKKFKEIGDSKLIMETIVYIPETVYKDMYEIETTYILFSYDNNREYGSQINYLNDFYMVNSQKFYKFDIITKSDIEALLEKELNPIKMFMWIILVVLLIISGINSMNTMFFSIKERIGEIGIKKSLGAGKLDIVMQFVLEGMFMAIIAGIIAVICAIWIGGIVGDIIQNIMFVSFTINYNIDVIVLPLVVAGIYGIVFSFVPSFYGANIKVTDALRFE